MIFAGAVLAFTARSFGFHLLCKRGRGDAWDMQLQNPRGDFVAHGRKRGLLGEGCLSDAALRLTPHCFKGLDHREAR
jgi:hypothetical protein